MDGGRPSFEEFEVSSRNRVIDIKPGMTGDKNPDDSNCLIYPINLFRAVKISIIFLLGKRQIFPSIFFIRVLYLGKIRFHNFASIFIKLKRRGIRK